MAAELAEKDEAENLDRYLTSHGHRDAMGKAISQAEFRLSIAKDAEDTEKWVKELARLHTRRRKEQA